MSNTRMQNPSPASSVLADAPVTPPASLESPAADAARTAFPILAMLSVCHLLNDLIQSLLPAIYPLLKQSFALDFGQIGLITLTFQLTASLLQPFVGIYTDKRPLPYSLAIGMGFTLSGLLLLSQAMSFPVLLLSAALIGSGSSVFHPESSRVARMASGGQHGLAQVRRFIWPALAGCSSIPGERYNGFRSFPRSSRSCCSRASAVGIACTSPRTVPRVSPSAQRACRVVRWSRPCSCSAC
jgi:FSR family fosmidomycin resistance protein-like MFS transporter